MSLLQWCLGTYRLDVHGTQLERFLNVLAYHGISLLQVKKNGDFCEIRIYRHKISSLYRLAEKYNIEVDKTLPEGSYRILLQCRKQSSFFIGAVFCFVFLLCMSHCIWKIDFEGNSYHTKEALLRYLRSRGVVYGSPVFLHSWEEEELLLRKEFSDVAWCSMSTDGCKLTVLLTESPEKENTIKAKKGEDLIASHDAYIRSIVTRSGTPLVKKGSRVKAGSVLVRGSIDYMDDAGEKEGQKKVIADADVIGVYKEPVCFRVKKNGKKPVTKPVGKRSGIRLNDIKVWLPGFFDAEEGTEVLTSYDCPAIFEKLPFSFVKITRNIYETELKSHIYSVKEAKVLFSLEMKRLYKKLGKNKSKVIEKNVHIEDNRKEVVLKGHLMVETKFSTYRKRRKTTGREKNESD